MPQAPTTVRCRPAKATSRVAHAQVIAATCAFSLHAVVALACGTPRSTEMCRRYLVGIIVDTVTSYSLYSGPPSLVITGVGCQSKLRDRVNCVEEVLMKRGLIAVGCGGRTRSTVFPGTNGRVSQPAPTMFSASNHPLVGENERYD